MELELVYCPNFESKEIRHYKSTGIEEIGLEKGADKKIPALLEYVNNYCTAHGFRVLDTKFLGENKNISDIVLVKQ